MKQNENMARVTLERLIVERGEDYTSLSKMIGRNAAYVQQFVKRGVPRKLAENDRRILARYFQVPETLLGAPEPEPQPDAKVVFVPRLSVRAAAGAGALHTNEASQHFAFDPSWLRVIGVRNVNTLSIITVEGDSMFPTLRDGDEILVDSSEDARRITDAVYVLRMDDALLVKRITVEPGKRTVTISSDNTDFRTVAGVKLESLDVAGRVFLLIGKVR